MLEVTDAYGFRFAYPAGDIAIGRCLRDYGEFSRVGSTLAGQCSRGRTFLDVGANIGAFALPVSRLAKRVVAIEAHPGLATVLAQNVRDNGIPNIDVIAAAAGRETGVVDFPAPSLDGVQNFGMGGFGRAGDPTRVPMVTLDDVAPADTAMVKIDVEGYEPEVLAGASRLIEAVRPTWLIESERETASTRSTLATMRRAHYRIYWVYDTFVTPLAPKAQWEGPRQGDLSIFCVPAEQPQPAQMLEAQPGDPWPKTTAGFEYLRAFQIRPVA